ncbi:MULTISPECIES: small, acid-soluble spore protein tlp [unclassified Sporosarcina]|uniref:small, acid-soluble spore protein tlp n=1 Tax=unclassified Sporosarcina TaxID=2647733 RepID=UPI000C169B07|nr:MULTISPECIES: small, acid-soluble spore protein tlp [unclassified Sporosarcina]PIC86094.1 small, acid-soluble spore protein tlp [Sporosarcina sp. P20a]PID00871.1 small, acid-soluble spore protein tlp [Sporosarcina sp. P29]PID07071.1 small, acid-soluble spore protein tlp [Sporosarcina sp. P30]PID10267.1 small, acid-soluble spore protein tlp [Sporosarcina sp. P31]PID12165.1 small, acid-soluble spore protein tlp [Sporosarcina sp. P32b]
MTKNYPKPNDSADNKVRLNKTISNMEAAEDAMKFAEGKEFERIKKKNERRAESIEDLEEEISEEDKSRINGYL